MTTDGDDAEASLRHVSAARMYDAAQGGKQNFRVDREALRRAEVISSDAGNALVAHHQHVHRVVRHLARAGIDQFVLAGTGLPSSDQAHETIHAVDPLARVVYAEKDRFMMAHAEAITGRATDRVRLVRCDLRHPATLLDDPVTVTFIDWERPVAVGVLAAHEIPPGEFDDLLRLRKAMAPGSRLWVTALSLDGYDDETRTAVAADHWDLDLDLHFRTREQALAMFDGLDLLDPGLVWAPEWHPDGSEVAVAPERTAWLGAVARV